MSQVIFFISPLHGSGKSTLARTLCDYLNSSGEKCYLISVGNEFRKIAEEIGYTSIEEFSRVLTENEELRLKIDPAIDKRTLEDITNSIGKYNHIVVDSNLGPFYGRWNYIFSLYSARNYCPEVIEE